MCLYRRCIMRLAVLLCGWLASPVASAQKASDVTTDTLTIRFRLDSVRIDMDYADNLRNWQTFEERFKYRFEKHTSGEIQVDIFAGASPEGPAIHNYWLGEQRGLSIRRLIRERLGNSVGRIAVHNEAARWSAFYDAVAESNEPWRDEVLRIIDMEPSANSSAWDHREVKLRNLHDGKVWPVLLDKYLSPLRSGGTAIVSWRPEPCDTVIVRDTVMMPVQTIPQDTIHIVQTDEPAPVICWRPYVAFKTNMLFDALMTPNLEVEAPIGWSRWSVMAEWWTPWYRWHGPNKHNRCYELLTLGAELRYWFSRREALCPRLLTGHFVGVYGAGGKYDTQLGGNDHEGWQGEFTSIGLTYGCSFHLGRHWRLELSASAGYVWGPQRYYHGMFDDTHLIWQHNDRLHYVGPTKLKVSIAYLLGRHVTRKGGRL